MPLHCKRPISTVGRGWRLARHRSLRFAIAEPAMYPELTQIKSTASPRCCGRILIRRASARLDIKRSMIKVGIIGYGYWDLTSSGTSTTARVSKSSPAATPAQNVFRPCAHCSDVKTVEDYHAITEDAGIDAVAIVTPVFTHSRSRATRSRTASMSL